MIARGQASCFLVQKALEKAFGEKNVDVTSRARLGEEYENEMGMAIAFGGAGLGEAEKIAFQGGADCFTQVKAPGTKAIAFREADGYFRDGTLLESDIPTKLTPEEEKNEAQLERLGGPEFALFRKNVQDFIASRAPTCKIREIHKHEYFNPEGPGTSADEAGVYADIHLTGCTISDYIKVLVGEGY